LRFHKQAKCVYPSKLQIITNREDVFGLGRLKYGLAAVIAMMVVGTSGESHGALIISAQQVSTNVVFTASGSLDITGLFEINGGFPGSSLSPTSLLSTPTTGTSHGPQVWLA
jgi:hypothetical protein